MADFDALVAEAKSADIRVIMDSSSITRQTNTRGSSSPAHRQHQSQTRLVHLAGRQRCRGQPPNNWQSWFGHSAWTLDAKTSQYYYHYFYAQQPDFNWRNPEVRKAMDDIMRFWMDKGVEGFRMDAVSRLFEDPNLHDDPYLPGYNAYGDRNIQHKYTDNFPEVNDVLERSAQDRRQISRRPRASSPKPTSLTSPN